jgi:hypothetical protein
MQYAIDKQKTLWISSEGKLYPFDSNHFSPSDFLTQEMSIYGSTKSCDVAASEFKELK